ncbi:SusC/RagA family TonB-linked outer membrane protein [Puteibacter caeruleilacunae]|nr:SusC/RagA family TonB-linked outer membrane protein [Puteibacter caeruleilacunae]
MKKMKKSPIGYHYSLWKKVLRIMKLTTVLMLVAILSVSAKGFSQSQKVRLNLKNVTIAKLLNEIEQQSDYRFAFSNLEEEVEQKVSIDVTDEALGKVLDQVLKGNGLNYEVVDKYVVVRKAEMAKQDSKNVVRGTVVDESGEALVGVTIVEKGTTNGTITNFDGQYTINAPVGSTLQITFIGFAPQDVKVTSASKIINITMKESAQDIDEVAVYGALGLKINEDAQANAMTVIRSKEVTENRDPNVMTSIKGNVPGLEVVESGNMMGSTKIVLRGYSSITGDNEALIVVDGVPYNNPSIKSSAGHQDNYRDMGSGLDDIDPNSIESITVLQGANAAALYGSMAANGAIIITTKKGRKQKGLGVSYTSTYSMEQAYVWPDLQNVYGHGYNVNKVGEWDGYYEDGLPITYMKSYGSWGPKMEGQQYRLGWRREHPIRTFDPQPDNYKDYFETGTSFDNNVTLSGASDKGTHMVSISSRNYKPILDNSEQNRYTLTTRVTHKLTDNFDLDTKLSYTVEDSKNRSMMGRSRSGFLGLVTGPRSFRIDDLRDYKYGRSDTQEDYWETYRMIDGAPVAFGKSEFDSNPFWTIYENENEDEKTRITGHLKLEYKIAKWLKANVKYAFDENHYNSYNMVPKFSRSYMWEGNIGESQGYYKSRNLSFMITSNSKITKDLKYTANFGGNRYYQESHSVNLTGYGFNGNTNYVFQNAKSTWGSPSYSEKAVNSLYGTFDLNYKDYLYFNVTGRNDWSSTLNPQNRSFFYPSVGGSFLFHKVLDVSDKILSYGKIRASWAEVGNATSPYIIHDYYTTFWQNGVLTTTLSPNIANYYLKPEKTRSLEVGADLQLFKNRFNINFTYYDARTLDQILPWSKISTSTGYTSQSVNAGEVRNYGIEGRISVVPIKAKDFKWEVDFNFAKNNSEVIELHSDLTELNLGTIWNNTGNIRAVPGEAYGAIYGFDFKKDDQGRVLVDNNGMPITNNTLGEEVLLGSAMRDWGGGVKNKFRYKNLSVSALVDFSVGGDIISISRAEMNYKGTTKESLAGREEWIAAMAKHDANGEDRPSIGSPYGGFDKYVGNSVFEQTGEVNAGDNAMYLNPAMYYKEMRKRKNHAILMDDASFVKLRSVNINYQLPKKLLENTFIKSANISLIGRNLAILHKNTDHFDPDRYLQSTKNGAIGIESGIWPSTRTFSVSINCKF